MPEYNSINGTDNTWHGYLSTLFDAPATTLSAVIQNTDNTATDSSAALMLTVGGSISTGDPFVNFLVTGFGTYSWGIDNDSGDRFKITNGASPSAGVALMEFDGAAPAIYSYYYHYLINNTPSDAAGARASRIIAKGYQSGNEFTTLGYMEFSHSGVGDDQLGQWILYVNDGNDGDTPTLILTALQDILVVGNATHPAQVGISLRQGDNASSGWRFGYSASTSNNLYLYCYETASLSFYTSTVLRWIMSSAGERTMPTQPSFLAYLAADALNKTGNGTSYTLGTDALTEVFDQGSDFNVNGTFTAPVTGRYDLKSVIGIIGTTAATTFTINIVTSNRTYTYVKTRAAAATNQSMLISALCDMDSADTATITIVVSGEAGDTDDIDGGASSVSYFCGSLIC